jgi:hypothetical protein
LTEIGVGDGPQAKANKSGVQLGLSAM